MKNTEADTCAPGRSFLLWDISRYLLDKFAYHGNLSSDILLLGRGHTAIADLRSVLGIHDALLIFRVSHALILGLRGREKLSDALLPRSVLGGLSTPLNMHFLRTCKVSEIYR